YSAGRAATTGRTGAVFNLQPPGCRGSYLVILLSCYLVILLSCYLVQGGNTFYIEATTSR
ncbi:hypothetical protein LVW09_29550, partial [Klebsiella pneumoniae]|nr:hypothetical protein [Klebsiella pneumoniae]